MRRYFRIALFAVPDLGYSSLSWRVKCALEAHGHTVFLFTPRRWPELFSEKTVQLRGLRRFFEVQRPDCMLFADGCDCADGEFIEAAGICTGVLTSSQKSAAQLSFSPDFVVEVSGTSHSSHSSHSSQVVKDESSDSGRDAVALFAAGEESVIYRVPAEADETYKQATLANSIAYARGILCLQDYTPEREIYLRSLVEPGAPYANRRIYCIGEGWSDEWHLATGETQLVYASRSSDACVVFAPDPTVSDSQADDFTYALIRGDKVAFIGEGAASLPNAAPADVSFDDALHNVLAQALPDECGTSSPRIIACVLGYVGRDNFGDEFILQLINERLRDAYPAASLIAIGENPSNILRERGIYAITLGDTFALDELLAHASAALVMAGLLFDQGMRWTMGKAELLSTVRYADIPGIAAYVSLAHLNDTPCVFYGIGAGPLELAESRTLVKYMGTLGAQFLARDRGTAALIASCGVADAQVSSYADLAFLSEPKATAFVDEWLSGEGIPKDAPLCVLSLRSYENVPSDFVHRVALALEAVKAAHPALHIIACVLDPADRELAEALCAACGELPAVHIFDAEGRLDPLADLFSRAYVGLSMRYHCALLCSACGVVCVGLGYLPKVAALYESLGAHDMLLDMDASADDISARLSCAMSEHDVRASVLLNKAQMLRMQAHEAETVLYGILERTSSRKLSYTQKEIYLNTKSSRVLDEEALRESCCTAQEQLCEAREQQEALASVRDEALSEAEEYRSSYSYRIGHALLALPRAIRRFIHPAP